MAGRILPTESLLSTQNPRRTSVSSSTTSESAEAHEPATRPACPPVSAPAGPSRKIFPVIPGRLSFTSRSAKTAVTREEIQLFRGRFYFSSGHHGCYLPFCQDFGPVDLAAVHDFCRYVRKFWRHCGMRAREMVYYITDDSLESRTNAAFLLAAFTVVDLGFSAEEAWAPFAEMPKGTTLSLLACLQGLSKALKLGWYSPEAFSVEDYVALENCGAGSIHQVAPKFIAFKSNVGQLAESTDHIVDEGALPPEHYVELFRSMGVSGVVRLNEPSTYDSRCFSEGGINHHDIFFDDCSLPDSATVLAFLEAAEAEEGVVAVHCRAGLACSGALIAVYLTKHDGFTAAEAIGWLRVVCPGSIIGGQQHFLHWYEATKGGTTQGWPPCELPPNLPEDDEGGLAPRPRSVELGRVALQAQIDKKRRQEAVGLRLSSSSDSWASGASTPPADRALPAGNRQHQQAPGKVWADVRSAVEELEGAQRVKAATNPLLHAGMFSLMGDSEGAGGECSAEEFAKILRQVQVLRVAREREKEQKLDGASARERAKWDKGVSAREQSDKVKRGASLSSSLSAMERRRTGRGKIQWGALKLRRLFAGRLTL